LAKCHRKSAINSDSGHTRLASLGSTMTNRIVSICSHAAQGAKVSSTTDAVVALARCHFANVKTALACYCFILNTFLDLKPGGTMWLNILVIFAPVLG
jgi:hypothetical protein